MRLPIASSVDSSVENRLKSDASASEKLTFKMECTQLFIPINGFGYLKDTNINRSTILLKL